MISWSVNYLFLANAALLTLLALFLASRKREAITWIFCVITGSLALWNVCIFLLEQKLFMASSLGAIVGLQLISAMVFANGLYYFCSSYPIYRPDRRRLVNLVVFTLFALAIVFTDMITHAEYVDGRIVYSDGVGYLIYSLYLSLMGLSALYRLVHAWRRYPEQRARIHYFFIGVATYVGCAIVFNLILPSFGNYDYLIIGRLSATLAPVLFFYAITKHEFLDTTVIINRGTAWVVSLLILLGLGVALHQVTLGSLWLNLLATMLAVVLAGLWAHPLQQFLLTTAKRKFIRGWYSTEEVINRLALRITQEKNREAIFREVGRLLDEVFELEETLVIVAVRDENEQFCYYRIAGRFQKIPYDDPLMERTRQWHQCQRLEAAPAVIQERLEDLQFKRGEYGMLLPFHSPEYLEGLVILGERSNQVGYSESDLRFFNNLISFLSPILYRLTPMEKLEKLYLESRQKLHEAEIQLLRAQKIESIAHATRQCHHEIRTPLNIIRMGIGRIRSLEDLEAYKKVAREEIDHALEIVEETLTITDMDKAEASRYRELNVNDVIQRCMRVIDRTRFEVQLDLQEVPKVLAAFSDLQVVITNLIHNALEAMPDGGTMAFSTHSSGNDVVITVEDDGEGIPESVRSRVWEPYFSGRGSEIGNSTAGRGWGLAIVNRLISEHQGTIRFTSEENVGTRFIITLPAKQRSGGVAESRSVSQRALS